MIQWSFHQEDVILNVYAPNVRASNMKRKLTELKGEIYKSAFIAGGVTHHDYGTADSNNRHCWLNTINLQYLIDISRLLHPTTIDYIWLSAYRTVSGGGVEGWGEKAYNCNWITIKIFFKKRTFTKIDHILGHKINCNKCKRTETTQYMFADHNGIKLEVNNRKKNQENLQTLNAYIRKGEKNHKPVMIWETRGFNKSLIFHCFSNFLLL